MYWFDLFVVAFVLCNGVHPFIFLIVLVGSIWVFVLRSYVFVCPYRVDAFVFISCLFPIVVLQRLFSICLLLIYFVVGFYAQFDALHTFLFSYERFDPYKLLLALRSSVELVPVMLRFRSSISIRPKCPPGGPETGPHPKNVVFVVESASF